MIEHLATRFRVFDIVSVSPSYQYYGDYRDETFIITGIVYNNRDRWSYREDVSIMELELSIHLTEYRDNKFLGAPTDGWKDEDLVLVHRSVK